MSDAPADSLWRIGGRACLQVTLVAWNVRNVAEGQYGLMFFTGCAVSWVWWANSRSAAHSAHPSARVVYALGAGIGTVLGALVGAYL